jgi:hypothetical protein
MRATLTAAALLTGLLAGVAAGQHLGPVIQELGPVVPTPEPSPKAERHIRLISSLTLGNRPDGESVITFEATDFGISGTGEDKKYRTIANEQYSLVDPKPGVRQLRDDILRRMRELETEMLRYVELSGPPRVRESVQSLGAGAVRP